MDSKCIYTEYEAAEYLENCIVVSFPFCDILSLDIMTPTFELAFAFFLHSALMT